MSPPCEISTCPFATVSAELLVVFDLVGLKEDRRVPVDLVSAGRELRPARRDVEQRRDERGADRDGYARAPLDVW